MRTFILYAFAVFLLSACSASKTLELKMDSTANDTYLYRSGNTTETNVSVMGMDQKVVVDQTTDQEYKVQKVNEDGSMDIKLTTKSMKMEQVTPMMSLKFDSENPEENEPAEMVEGFKSMIGKEYQLKLSPKGKVLELSTEGKVFDGVFENIPNGEVMAEQMESQFGTDAIRSSMSQVTGFYPDQPVKVGDTWTKNNNVSAGMKMIVETVYTLTERKGDIALIEFSGTVKTDPSADPVDMMGMEMTYDLAGTQKGTIRVNEKTGWTQRTEGKQEMKGKMNMKGGQIGEVSADMDMVSNYTYEKIEQQ